MMMIFFFFYSQQVKSSDTAGGGELRPYRRHPVVSGILSFSHFPSAFCRRPCGAVTRLSGQTQRRREPPPLSFKVL